MSRRPRYQLAPDDDLHELVWRAGRFSALQMMRVAAWKSARGLASLTLNSEEEIAQRTALALNAIAPWRTVNVLVGEVQWEAWRSDAATAIGSKDRDTGLLGLHGFRYPMASAFLAFLAPGAFPIIDRWTVRAIYGSRIRRYDRSVVYTHFAHELVAHSEDFSVTTGIHFVDQAVMNRAMKCDHVVRPCPCYPFWPVRPPVVPR